jgi:hypothetical protein
MKTIEIVVDFADDFDDDNLGPELASVLVSMANAVRNRETETIIEHQKKYLTFRQYSTGRGIRLRWKFMSKGKVRGRTNTPRSA